MRHSRQTGFTLIELMITVVLFGVLAALALPSFLSILENRRLIGATDNLFTDLHYTRSESIKRNEDITLDIVASGANWSYQIVDSTNNVLRAHDSSNFRNIQLSVANDIDFEPRQGMPDASQSYTFRIGSAGRVHNVCVNAIGRIRNNGDTACP